MYDIHSPAALLACLDLAPAGPTMAAASTAEAADSLLACPHWPQPGGSPASLVLYGSDGYSHMGDYNSYSQQQQQPQQQLYQPHASPNGHSRGYMGNGQRSRTMPGRVSSKAGYDGMPGCFSGYSGQQPGPGHYQGGQHQHQQQAGLRRSHSSGWADLLSGGYGGGGMSGYGGGPRGDICDIKG
jgi:hypothetical protein